MTNGSDFDDTRGGARRSGESGDNAADETTVGDSGGTGSGFGATSAGGLGGGGLGADIGGSLGSDVSADSASDADAGGETSFGGTESTESTG